MSESTKQPAPAPASMGWITTPSGRSAFVVGNQVLAESSAIASTVTPRITNRVLPGASKFGVNDYFTELASQDSEDSEELAHAAMTEYKRQVREDIERTLRMFFDSGVFARPEVPAAVLGAMLRPTMPVRPAAPLLLCGPTAGTARRTAEAWGGPRADTAYLAAAIMGGWRAEPHSWTEHSLPGQVGDTRAATELASSMTPIWVADGPEPAVMRRLLRSARESSGMLVVTTERVPSHKAVRRQAVVLDVGGRAFTRDADSGDAVDELREFFTTDPALPRLTAAMVRQWFLGERMQWRPWADRVEANEQMLTTAKYMAEDQHLEWAPSASKRRGRRYAKPVADLVAPFLVLAELASWAGIQDSHPAMRHLLMRDNSSAPKQLLRLATDAFIY